MTPTLMRTAFPMSYPRRVANFQAAMLEPVVQINYFWTAFAKAIVDTYFPKAGA